MVCAVAARVGLEPVFAGMHESLNSSRQGSKSTVPTRQGDKRNGGF